MVAKPYTFAKGAKLEDHTKQKHKILREYFDRYLWVRCRLPQQSKFRVAIVDGFAGGGRYEDGSPGSPIIFLEALQAATEAFNIQRAADKMAELSIECLLILNDDDPEVVDFLKTQVAPVLAAIKDTRPKLHVQVEFLNKPFERAYPEIKALLERGSYPSVLFNLDQCGHSQVHSSTLTDIMRSFRAPEIFYTFMIEALIAFLRKGNADRYRKQLNHLNLPPRSSRHTRPAYEQPQLARIRRKGSFRVLSRLRVVRQPVLHQQSHGMAVLAHPFRQQLQG